MGLNLDLRQLLQDFIERCEDPALLNACWEVVTEVKVLDPTCGSGAFLFAALNILEPLYDAVLDRMAVFTDDPRQQPQAGRWREQFERVLADVNSHANERFFILKTIVISNLYGVDITEEAVEICKLRLFLKLAAQVEWVQQIEPLPDIDFNVRAGNTLVGFADLEHMQRVIEGIDQRRFDLGGDLDRLTAAARAADDAYEEFRALQTSDVLDPAQLSKAKTTVRDQLERLRDDLDGYLAGEYGISDDSDALAEWRRTHQPFHWFVEFYATMRRGGFDVVIGNPPYVPLAQVGTYEVRDYATASTGNVYALVLERCLTITTPSGRLGMIVPVSSISTDKFAPLQHLLLRTELFHSSYDDRPSHLFEGLEHARLAILLADLGGAAGTVHSTRYHRWTKEERQHLFTTLTHEIGSPGIMESSLPKLNSEVETRIIQRLCAGGPPLGDQLDLRGEHKVFYTRKLGNFLQVLDFVPEIRDADGKLREPSELKVLRFASEARAACALCCLNSGLFYWFVRISSDCRNLNRRDMAAFPVDLDRLARGESGQRLTKLAQALMGDIAANSEMRTLGDLAVQTTRPGLSKDIIDQIDAQLGRHYGFDAEELDFIVNFDAKYRATAE